jgi:parafibromin
MQARKARESLQIPLLDVCSLRLIYQGNMHPIVMISSSPTALITMHNVKRFLQESAFVPSLTPPFTLLKGAHSFEPSADARSRAAAEGNIRPEDVIPIYRKRTTIDSSGKEHETQATYYVVDSIEALAKFGTDAWDRVVCVMTTGQAWQFKPYKWPEPRALFHHGAPYPHSLPNMMPM